MRMHRGSSKGTREDRVPEILPLSASPPLEIRFEIVRAGASASRTLSVPPGTLLRQALRALGHAPEGCAVLRGDRPVPLDLELEADGSFTVIPTFSGG
jgi:sulfur carrier protein ThiS